MWKVALKQWIAAQKAAKENTKLLLDDPAINGAECTRRMLALEDAEVALQECGIIRGCPMQVRELLGAQYAMETETHDKCIYSSSPEDCCPECQAITTRYFQARDWLINQGESLLS